MVDGRGPVLAAGRSGRGRVAAIWVRATANGTPVALERVQAVAGAGLEGDRYRAGVGTFSDLPGSGRHLTLIEAEALDALARETGIQLDAAASGRNLVTEGIDLNALVGHRFRIGPVECVGTRLCEPCDHLAQRTEPGVLRGLVHRGGLRADVLVDGEIAVGATIVPLDAPTG
ncbi:MAG: MOSC domain-containing protein [Thermoleophilia bacterium]